MSKTYWRVLSAWMTLHPRTLTVWQSGSSVTLFHTSTRCWDAPVRMEWTARHRHSRYLRTADLCPFVSAIVPEGESSILPGMVLRSLLRSWRLRLRPAKRGGGTSLDGSVKGHCWEESLAIYSRLVFISGPGLLRRFPFHEVPSNGGRYVPNRWHPSEPLSTSRTIGRALALRLVRACFRVRRLMCRAGCQPRGCTCGATNRFALLLQDLNKFL